MKLTGLTRYQNVTLYPGARAGIIDELFDTCDYYLDINREAEIVSAVKQKVTIQPSGCLTGNAPAKK